MTAEVECYWSVFCEDCDWEANDFETKQLAAHAAADHNDEYHQEEK